MVKVRITGADKAEQSIVYRGKKKLGIIWNEDLMEVFGGSSDRRWYNWFQGEEDFELTEYEELKLEGHIIKP